MKSGFTRHMNAGIPYWILNTSVLQNGQKRWDLISVSKSLHYPDLNTSYLHSPSWTYSLSLNSNGVKQMHTGCARGDMSLPTKSTTQSRVRRAGLRKYAGTTRYTGVHLHSRTRCS